MNVRVGIDVVSIERVGSVVERWGSRFLDRVFTPGEQNAARGRLPSLAVRFAAKEAVLKALGTGLDGGITWHDVEILGTGEAPRVRLRGRALACARELGLTGWTLSLSHDAGVAVAVAIAWGESL